MREYISKGVFVPVERPDKRLPSMLLTILITGIILYVSCGPSTQPKFHEGELVRMKLDGRVGMVIYVYNNFNATTNGGTFYDMRVSSDRVFTDTKLLEKDGAVHSLPYQKIVVNEYELEKMEDGK